MGGHATHDETEARSLFPAEQFASWGRRDPIGMYETWLVESGPRLAGADPALAAQLGIDPGAPAADPPAENRRILAAIEERVVAEVEAAAEAALRSRAAAEPSAASALEGVYAGPGGQSPD